MPPNLSLNPLGSLSMLVATWNVNHRVGKTRYQSRAASAAAAIGADLLVLTEYFPQSNHNSFCESLRSAGYTEILTTEIGSELANRVLVAANTRLERLSIPVPTFDEQMPSNQLAVFLPDRGLSVVGVRIPVYTSPFTGNLIKCWDWLEATAFNLKSMPALIAGDLNVSPVSRRGVASRAFAHILANGWRRVIPREGSSYFGTKGTRSELDHVLVTDGLTASDAHYLSRHNGHSFAGDNHSLSDHAPLVAQILVQKGPHA